VRVAVALPLLPVLVTVTALTSAMGAPAETSVTTMND